MTQATLAYADQAAANDSSLLWDVVRVMVRLLKGADALIGGRLVWRDHRRGWEQTRLTMTMRGAVICRPHGERAKSILARLEQ